MTVANIVDDWPAPRRYTRGERLGAGATGETFAAEDVEAGGPCVIKVFTADASARDAAVAEFRGLVSLSHPNIVRVRDVGRLEDGRLYLVTDRIVGTGIEGIAAISDEPARRAALETAARDLAGALAHLHARGLCHGDVCPANVRLREDGRAVLIDFGLAGPPMPGNGAARGTLGYAPPEALTGARTPAADLFGLGATLFEAFSGVAPFGRGLPAVERMLAGPAPPLSTLRPGLSPGWDALIARLLSPEPAERPASARDALREVLRLSAGADTPTEIDLGIPYPDGDPLDGIVVGRVRERSALRAALDRLADGAASASVLTLVGAPGSGRRTLFEVVAREVAIAGAAGVMPALEIWRGDVEALEATVGRRAEVGAGDHARASEANMARVAEALEARARDRPLCVWLDEDDTSAALAAFLAGAPASGRVLVVVPVRAPLARPFEQAVTLEPLSAADVAELVSAGVDAAPPAAAVRAIAAAAQGHAALVGVLARRLVFGVRAGIDRVSIESGTDLDALLAAGFAGLAPEAQALVLALALADDAGIREAAGLDEASGVRARAATRAAGWTTIAASGADRLPSTAHRRVALAGGPASLRRQVAARALARLAAGDPRRPDALAAAGRPDEAAAALRLAAVAAGEQGAPAKAALLYERMSSLAPGTALSVGEHLIQVTGLALLGRYPDAAQAVAAARAGAAGAPGRALCAEREAWLLARRGDVDGARRVLADALADAGEAGEAGWALRARLGRLQVTAGRFRDALAAIEPLFAAAPSGDGGVRALALETAVLAHAYVGEIPQAKARLAELEAGRGASEGRTSYLAAVVAQLGGEEAQALERYRHAYELASHDGDLHTVAAVALNLGGLLAEQGVYGEALQANERAVRELGRLGAAGELRAALVNAANLLTAIGDLPAARRALGRAQAANDPGRLSLASAAAAFVAGDIESRAGQPQAAARLYRAASRDYLQAGQRAYAASALASAAEALCSFGRADEARRALGEALALGDETEVEGDDLLRARGRLNLVDGAPDDGPPVELAARLAAAAQRAHAAARRPRAWRLAVLGARILERAGDVPAAEAALAVARTIFEEVQMSTPERHRVGLAGDPDAFWLSGRESGGDASVTSRALAAEARLRRLLRINKRLNSELRLPRLLEMIVDTVIELTDAERGFLLIEDDKGELTVKVARNIDQRTLETAEFELSRSIARQAALGGEPIVTIDAAGDARFRQAVSVSDLHLRSVLAVPLVIKGRAAGTIYVDHRLRKGAFGQDDVRLVMDFAEQAAIALENARLLAEVRRRERQIDALNRRLELELAAGREELSGIKQELRDNREALAVRYDYHNIIGRTPRMLDLFRLLDRITDTTLPVVIQGESGTGKELVARAIHANGPRRGRPFVGENCAAIPETLLESTLFGYVRGAFTGAEHDTRGLFEVADSGTLFLDEVGEMSPAMQGKLLRVLQEGELRRVGSERTRKVDVRIVAATNRDLTRLVEEGKFRRDLFFRLNVAQIALPALRERRDDIPLMVETFLARLAKKAGRGPKLLDPGALARLCAHRWPGNVRELENEITRADALSGERITLADLSPQVAAAGDPGALAASDPDSLLLRPRVERLERSLLREALGRAGNNQTKAAELLGLSRFGLQKKLKRYRFA